MMILGVTATRYDLTDYQLECLDKWIQRDDVTEVHHGDCVGGDALIHQMAIWYRKKIVVHPPDKSQLRAFTVSHTSDVIVLPPRPYLVRNRAIVDACDWLLVVPYTAQEQGRSGTWSTYRYALKTGVPTKVILPSDHERLILS